MDESATRLVAVVDDDASLRRSVRNLLVSVGLPVVTFPTAEAFLQSSQLYSRFWQKQACAYPWWS